MSTFDQEKVNDENNINKIKHNNGMIFALEMRVIGSAG